MHTSAGAPAASVPASSPSRRAGLIVIFASSSGSESTPSRTSISDTGNIVSSPTMPNAAQDSPQRLSSSWCGA